MAATARFPHLAPPFALVGAAAGWLSAGLVANPMVRAAEGGTQPVAALVAMIFGAWTGFLLTHWCIRKRYAYELEEASFEELSETDRWYRHIPVVLSAGAGTGALVAAVCGSYHGPKYGAMGGFLCALAFVPVCSFVISTARKARRARFGSIVAASDRRAVWGVLSTTLSVATLEAAIDWPAARVGDLPVPLIGVGILGAAGLVVAFVLWADVKALAEAKRSFTPGFAPREANTHQADDSSVPKLDFGLGEEQLAKVARSGAAYRGLDRTLSIIQGDPEKAFSALRKAIRRGMIGVGVVACAGGLHLAAKGALLSPLYDEIQCDNFDGAACLRWGDRMKENQPNKAAFLYEKGCNLAQAEACAKAAEMGNTTDSVKLTLEEIGRLHQRACDGGVVSSCRAAALSHAY